MNHDSNGQPELPPPPLGRGATSEEYRANQKARNAWAEAFMDPAFPRNPDGGWLTETGHHLGIGPYGGKTRDRYILFVSHPASGLALWFEDLGPAPEAPDAMRAFFASPRGRAVLAGLANGRGTGQVPEL